MKKTILMSLLAFMILPLMAQKLMPIDCDRYMQEVADVGFRYIFVNPFTDVIEYTGYAADFDLDENMVGTVTNPFNGHIRNIKIISPETSGRAGQIAIDTDTGEELFAGSICSCRCWCCQARFEKPWADCWTCTSCTGCSADCAYQTYCGKCNKTEICHCRVIVVD